MCIFTHVYSIVIDFEFHYQSVIYLNTKNYFLVSNFFSNAYFNLILIFGDILISEVNLGGSIICQGDASVVDSGVKLEIASLFPFEEK